MICKKREISMHTLKIFTIKKNEFKKQRQRVKTKRCEIVMTQTKQMKTLQIEIYGFDLPNGILRN